MQLQNGIGSQATSAGTQTINGKNTTAVVAATGAAPPVVIAPVKPAINKTLLYVGGALLLWMVLKKKTA